MTRADRNTVTVKPLSDFFIVIDPDKFIGREEFNRISGEIVRELRNSKKAPGCPGRTCRASRMTTV